MYPTNCHKYARWKFYCYDEHSQCTANSVVVVVSEHIKATRRNDYFVSRGIWMFINDVVVSFFATLSFGASALEIGTSKISH